MGIAVLHTATLVSYSEQMQSLSTLFYPQPDWIRQISGDWNLKRSTPELMQILYKVAGHGVGLGYGPFAAALTRASGEIIDCNVNQVTHQHDCGAHAESVVLQNGQRILISDGTVISDLNEYTLLCSGQPCVGCAGRIWLYRPGRVIYGASKEEIERIANFTEGPVAPDFWERAKSERSIVVSQDLSSSADRVKPLELFAKAVQEGRATPYLLR